MFVHALQPEELVLVEELLPSPDRDVHARRLGLQRTGSATYYIAWLGDRPVGHTLVRWGGAGNPLLGSATGPPPAHPYIEGLAVHAAFQSRGIGAQIIEAVEHEARRHGFREIGLAVSVETYVRVRCMHGSDIVISAWGSSRTSGRTVMRTASDTLRLSRASISPSR